MGRRATARKPASSGPRPPTLGDLCPNCSESLSDLDRFCPACGTVLPGGEEE